MNVQAYNMTGEFPYRQREWLDYMHWDEELTTHEMAEVAGCAQKTIMDWMIKLGVSRRTNSEASQLRGAKPEERARRSVAATEQLKRQWADFEYRASMSGANSPVWVGDALKSDYPRDFNAQFRVLVLDADDNHCAVCGRDKKWFFVHHIDYDKTHTDLDNCVTLCPSCHYKVHVKKAREKWRKYFERYVRGNQ